ncbi:hypothetical protein ACE2AJ_03665 [Aquihabitans daechungensis]|uniref:hypothetical protein n=1 Tax=Aquihabitans daechungensis TaxID=1052257 RepID=UPI003BA09F54
MAADNQVCDVLRAMEMLEGRVRSTTRSEIGFLVPMTDSQLDQVLARAEVGGWVTKHVVHSSDERAGVRPGTAVYQLTEMSCHRTLVA